MDEAVQSYIDGIDPAHRPLFDQIHELVMAAHPEATVVLSYQMPTYRVGEAPALRRRLAARNLAVRLGAGPRRRLHRAPSRAAERQEHDPAAAAGRGGPGRRRAPRPGQCCSGLGPRRTRTSLAGMTAWDERQAGSVRAAGRPARRAAGPPGPRPGRGRAAALPGLAGGLGLGHGRRAAPAVRRPGGPHGRSAPLPSAPGGDRAAGGRSASPAPLLAPDQAGAELDGPAVVRSGHTLHHGLLVRDRSGAGLAIATNGRVTAVVVDPATDEVVGGFAGLPDAPAGRLPGAAGRNRADPAAHRHGQHDRAARLRRAAGRLGHPGHADPHPGRRPRRPGARSASDPGAAAHDHRLTASPIRSGRDW